MEWKYLPRPLIHQISNHFKIVQNIILCSNDFPFTENLQAELFWRLFNIWKVTYDGHSSKSYQHWNPNGPMETLNTQFKGGSIFRFYHSMDPIVRPWIKLNEYCRSNFSPFPKGRSLKRDNGNIKTFYWKDEQNDWRKRCND